MEQLRQLKGQMEQQQSQIKDQQQQIQQLQQQLQTSNTQLQQQNQQLQNSVQQVGQQASAAQQAASDLNTSVASLKTNTDTLSQGLTEAKARVQELQSPAAIRYRGLSLTPGGFLDMEFITRTRNENADVASSFLGAPLGGVANSKLTEVRGSARLSRITLLADGKAGATNLRGYYEMDFASVTPASYVQTNPWAPRMRQAWGQASFSHGWTLSAGQFWTLLTTNRKGIGLLNEFIPMTDEAAYVAGYTYVRQAAVRVTKKFNDHVWGAFEVANPEMTLYGSAPNGVFGFSSSTNASSPNGLTVNYSAGTCSAPTGYVCNPSASALTTGLSANAAPDLIAKVAFEPGWGHYEIKAIGRFFRDYVDATNTTSGAVLGSPHGNITVGGGLGMGAILPVVPHKVDVILEGLVGEGIGRYGAGANADVMLRQDGSIVPLKSMHLMAGVEAHPIPKLDVFVYGGDEYYKQSLYRTNTGALAGYGTPTANNTQCNLNYIVSGTCTAYNKNLWEGTVGFNYRFYRGPYGTFQYGAQVEYFYRDTWSGVGGAPKGLDTVVFNSFRFILP